MIQLPPVALLQCCAMISEFPLSFSYRGCATKKKITLRILGKTTIGPIYQFLFFLFAAFYASSSKVHSISLLPVFLHSFLFLYHASLTTFLSLLSSHVFHVFTFLCTFAKLILLSCLRVLLTKLTSYFICGTFNTILGILISKRSTSFSSYFFLWQ